MPKSLIAEHLCGHKDQKDRDTYIILGHNADAALFHKGPGRQPRDSEEERER